jgi:acetyltransferase-like isoleucine patch superfamily enzyme
MFEEIAILRGKIFILFCKMFKKNIKIGKGLKIYKKLSIKGNGKIKIGKNCTVDGIIGDNSQYVTIDTHSDGAVIIIGDNVKLFAARISSKFYIKLGSDLFIEEAGILDTDFHSIDESRESPVDERIENCKIEIGDRVMIGVKSIVTKGVSIGNDAVIGPGSIVKDNVESCTFVMGNPARRVT